MAELGEVDFFGWKLKITKLNIGIKSLRFLPHKPSRPRDRCRTAVPEGSDAEIGILELGNETAIDEQGNRVAFFVSIRAVKTSKNINKVTQKMLVEDINTPKHGLFSHMLVVTLTIKCK